VIYPGLPSDNQRLSFLGHVIRAAQDYSDVPGTIAFGLAIPSPFRHSLPGMTGERDAKLSRTMGFRRDVKTQGKLFRLPVKRVNFLGAGVAKQERRIIGSHTQPDTPVACLAEMFQVGDGFDFVIANADSHH